jgi:predicted ABC-type transport system involved in lysophospholipase L1 biosynthesis ATPase subunit
MIRKCVIKLQDVEQILRNATTILTVFEGFKMDADKGKRSFRAGKFASGKPGNKE